VQNTGWQNYDAVDSTVCYWLLATIDNVSQLPSLQAPRVQCYLYCDPRQLTAPLLRIIGSAPTYTHYPALDANAAAAASDTGIRK